MNFDTEKSLLTPDTQIRRLNASLTNTSTLFSSALPDDRLRHPGAPSIAGSQPAVAPLIYAVDDLPYLTQLYALWLGAAGWRVSTFNDRAAALAALQAHKEKPDILITDYLGHAVPFEWFIHDCLAIHPGLRILMASGFDQTVPWRSLARPHRFLQKPFTARQLQEEVSATLAGQ